MTETNDNFRDYSQDGALFVPAAPIDGVNVNSVSSQGAAKTKHCPMLPTAPNNLVPPAALIDYAKTPQPWLTSPEVQTVEPGRFASLSWPDYDPATPDRPKGAVLVGVDVRTSASGVPLVAYLRDSSIAPGFAMAALDAAMASTYIIRRAPEGTPSTETFHVDYIYEPPT